MAKDLTTGRPLRLIFSFMLPILLGNVVQQLYSIVDTVIVGRTISTFALGGVGATGHIVFFILGFAIGITSGFTVIISQRFGAGDIEGVKRSVAVSFVLTAVIAVIMTAVATPLTMSILKLLKTPETLIGYSYDYLFVIFSGMSGTLFYNLVSSILRSVGDSKTPLFFLVISSGLNIGLDLFFIIVFKWGVAGAGLATVLSQTISATACLIYMLKKHPLLRFSLKHLKGMKELAIKKLKLGIPLGFGNSVCAIGLMAQQSVINGFGEIAVSALSASYTIDNILIQVNSAFGISFVTYAGQNLGAGKFSRIRQGFKSGAVIAVALALVEIALIVTLLKPMISLFIASPSDEIMYYARNYMFVQAFTYIIQLIFFMFRNTAQGLGRSSIGITVGCVEAGSRLISVTCLSSALGFTAVSISNPISWAMALVVSVLICTITLKGKQDKETITVD